jgi:hypothetical protein
MMQRALVLVGLLSVSLLASAQSQQSRPWWAGIELGDGQLKLTSDQHQSSRGAAFAFGIFGGHRVGNRARIGMQVNGWLLEASSLSDPTVGESVSTVLGIFDFFPVRKIPFFFRGGTGLAMYSNNHPGAVGGHGFAWTAGAGYEIPLTNNVGMVPVVDYASGGFGDARNPDAVLTNRRYSVIEFKAGFVWHFGKAQNRQYRSVSMKRTEASSEARAPFSPSARTLPNASGTWAGE